MRNPYIHPNEHPKLQLISPSTSIRSINLGFSTRDVLQQLQTQHPNEVRLPQLRPKLVEEVHVVAEQKGMIQKFENLIANLPSQTQIVLKNILMSRNPWHCTSCVCYEDTFGLYSKKSHLECISYTSKKSQRYVHKYSLHRFTLVTVSARYLIREPDDDVERRFDEAHGEFRKKREAYEARAADHERHPAHTPFQSPAFKTPIKKYVGELETESKNLSFRAKT